MVLLTHKSTAKCAGRGFARQGDGAPWRGKNKDPSRQELASGISSVCFYTHPPARPRRNRLPHNSKAGMNVFCFKALPITIFTCTYYNATCKESSGVWGYCGKARRKGVACGRARFNERL